MGQILTRISTSSKIGLLLSRNSPMSSAHTPQRMTMKMLSSQFPSPMMGKRLTILSSSQSTKTASAGMTVPCGKWLRMHSLTALERNFVLVMRMCLLLKGSKERCRELTMTSGNAIRRTRTNCGRSAPYQALPSEHHNWTPTDSQTPQRGRQTRTDGTGKNQDYPLSHRSLLIPILPNH